MIGSAAPARYPLASPFCARGPKSIAQHGSKPTGIESSCLVYKSQIDGYGTRKVKPIYRSRSKEFRTLIAVENQPFKDIKTKVQDIKKAHHNGWASMVCFVVYILNTKS